MLQMSDSIYLGLDVGASNIRIGLGNEDTLFSDKQRRVPTEEYWSEEGILNLILGTLDRYSISPDEVDGIGIGVPGLVDLEEDRMELSYALDELSFEELSKLDIDFQIENDANTAVMGEKLYGDGGDLDTVATVIIGSGIGGGVYYNGNLLGSQKDGRSPEPTGIVVEGGTTWDGSVGGENMPKYVTNLLEEDERETGISQDISAEEIFELSEEKEVVQECVDRLTELNARGIATMVNLYAPELVTFSGSVAVNNPEFMEDSFDKVEEHAINPVPDMKISELGNELGLYGALALAQKDK